MKKVKWFCPDAVTSYDFCGLNYYSHSYVQVRVLVLSFIFIIFFFAISHGNKFHFPMCKMLLVSFVVCACFFFWYLFMFKQTLGKCYSHTQMCLVFFLVAYSCTHLIFFLLFLHV